MANTNEDRRNLRGVRAGNRKGRQSKRAQVRAVQEMVSRQIPILGKGGGHV